MQIREITRHEMIAFLEHKDVGRLACAHDGQPYVAPINFVYHEDCLYCFSTVGKRIEWMRTNPLVCFEADEIDSPQQWTTVVVSGRYEELPNTPQFSEARKLAYALLQRRPLWWEPGYARTILEGTERPLELVYFRILIASLSGHRAQADEGM